VGELIKLYREFFAQRWHEKKSGAVLTPIMGLFGWWLAKELFDGGSIINCIAAILLSGATLIIWLLARRLPKASGKAIGVVVGLICDNEEQSQQIKTDFSDRVKTLLKESKVPFQVVVLPKRALDGNDDEAHFTRLLDEARGHFGVFGRVRKRQEKKKDVYLLNLRHVVRHRPIPEAVGKTLANEMTSLLPIDVMVEKENEASGFEFASQWMDLGTRFVVGTAAMLSGDLKTAEQMFLELESQVKANPSKANAIEVAKRLRGRFIELYTYWLRATGQFYRQKQTKEILKEMDAVSTKLLARDRHNYDALHVKPICDFKLRREIRNARRLLNQARILNKDATWAYSLGFLSAYEGRLTEADTFYDMAFAANNVHENIPIQCEEFIYIILAEEPGKGQLHYCLGLINYHAKRDMVAARRDFDTFINWKGSAKEKQQLEKSKRIVAELEATNIARPETNTLR
jgi:tetratricopeptide (TPR) repeat protein